MSMRKLKHFVLGTKNRSQVPPLGYFVQSEPEAKTIKLKVLAKPTSSAKSNIEQSKDKMEKIGIETTVAEKTQIKAEGTNSLIRSLFKWKTKTNKNPVIVDVEVSKITNVPSSEVRLASKNVEKKKIRSKIHMEIKKSNGESPTCTEIDTLNMRLDEIEKKKSNSSIVFFVFLFVLIMVLLPMLLPNNDMFFPKQEIITEETTTTVLDHNRIPPYTRTRR